MQVQVLAAQDREAANRGMVDIVFRRNPQKATVITVTKDELLDLGVEIDATRESELFADYEAPDDYGMYGPSGDREVENLVATVNGAIKNGLSEDEAREYIDTEMDRIAGTHSEVWDTDAREAIAEEISPVWKIAFGADFSL